MIRTDIEIPKNIKYLGEIRNIELPYGTFDRFELPNGILNKDVPNCVQYFMDINLNIKEDMELKLDNLNKIKPEHSPVLFLNLCTLIYRF